MNEHQLYILVNPIVEIETRLLNKQTNNPKFQIIEERQPVVTCSHLYSMRPILLLNVIYV